jgi:1-acyl-sn-glycerol-3-phosphate acyltransferase
VFAFPRLAPAEREKRVERWAQDLLERFGVTLEVRGAPPVSGPLLLVANHISWLDIVVLHAARYCRFVSKANVRHWPLIGTLATGAGTLYVERESRRDAMRVVHRMVEALRQGDVLAIFPEGTTSDGSGVLPFHANLLQAAITAEAPVQPLTLQFFEGTAPSRAVAYVGDDSLIGSIWRTLCTDNLRAIVMFGEPQHAAGRDRRAWARDLRDRIIFHGRFEAAEESSTPGSTQPR